MEKKREKEREREREREREGVRKMRKEWGRRNGGL